MFDFTFDPKWFNFTTNTTVPGNGNTIGNNNNNNSTNNSTNGGGGGGGGGRGFPGFLSLFSNNIFEFQSNIKPLTKAVFALPGANETYQ